MKIKQSLVVLFAVFLSACASMPPGNPAMMAKVKRFDPPSEGKAGVYVIRPSALMGSGLAWYVMLDNSKPTKLTNATFLYVEVDPGKHQLRPYQRDALLSAFSAKDVNLGIPGSFMAQVGKHYYFMLDLPGAGMFVAPTQRISEIPEERGKRYVEKLTYVDSIFESE